MAILEVLVWLVLGGAPALAKLTPGSFRQAPRGSWLLVALGAGAALSGGLVGLAVMRPGTELGEYNVASMVLAATATAVALLVQDAVVVHRSRRLRR